MLDNFDPFSSNFNPFNFVKSANGFSCYYDKENKENVLTADLPGLNSNDINIKLEDGKNIIVSGERKCEDRQYIFSSPWCGEFFNQISLNKSISPSDIKTSYKNGVVKISIINQKDIIVSGIQSKLGNETNKNFHFTKNF
ncbi:hypothetical protein DICPUDRAFT_75212 [Dictyostelium purpureum]|uniref:SHSP domain-containing protein n=1 Tax=Dictyostelium purpureum TaxID=5786 RepID=F0ZA02_DICPU|nr:uncharacterized protein DICPUDRAFT_75212 [Dictyostelium purpureum]EGC39240.1 hypothetical protein DICPUDRAFT_75212 [Dictyostelium purpureum]|eukprot:XP_003284267.1 hypothetical protein DICPUDRAFT_75212 [Dictyostelium purpureum]